MNIGVKFKFDQIFCAFDLCLSDRCDTAKGIIVGQVSNLEALNDNLVIK